MNTKHFTPDGWSKIERSIAGIDTCVPRALPPRLHYDGALLGVLSAADRAMGQLAGITRTLPNPRLLIRSFISREAVLSSRIEGTIASLSDLFLFEVNSAIEEDVPDVREVSNYVRALDHGVTRLRQIPLTLNLIRELHGILLEGVRGSDRRPGEFRRCQNWIGSPRSSIVEARYVPPAPERLGSLLDAFERFINTPNDIPLLVRLAIVHFQFEAIHPFEDGNGRVGRLLISLLLDSERAIPHPVLYLSAYLEKHRSDYYDLLLAVSQRGAWEDWILFFLRGVTEQSIDAVERAASLLSLRDAWARRCQDARTSSLLIRLVDELFLNPFMTVARAGAALDVRAQSAQNNINQLVAMDILKEVTGRRRNRIYLAPDIMKALDERPAFDLPNPPEATHETQIGRGL